MAGPHSRLRCPLRGSKPKRQEAAGNLVPHPGPGRRALSLVELNSVSTRCEAGSGASSLMTSQMEDEVDVKTLLKGAK